RGKDGTDRWQFQLLNNTQLELKVPLATNPSLFLDGQKTGIGLKPQAHALTVRSATGQLLQFTNSAGNEQWEWNLLGQQNDLVLAESNGFAYRLVLRRSGGMGLNTINPDRPLTIGANSEGQLLSLQNNATQTRWHLNMDANDNLNIAETGVADHRLFLRKGGNVGIGTNAPNARLHVTGATGSTVTILTNGRLRSGDATNNGGIWLTPTDDALMGVTGLNMGFYSQVAGWGLIMQRSSGRVGIGTQNPSYRLHVTGTITEAGIFESNSANGTRLAIANTAAGGKQWWITSTGNSLGSSNAGKLEIRTENSLGSPITLLENGRIGFSTSNPDAQLHARTTLVSAARFDGTHANGTQLEISNESGGSNARWALLVGGSAQPAESGRLIIRAPQGGNALEFSSGSPGGARAGINSPYLNSPFNIGTGSGTSNLLSFFAQQAELYRLSIFNSGLRMQVMGQGVNTNEDAFFVDHLGRMALGQTTAAERLDVHGNARIRGHLRIGSSEGTALTACVRSTFSFNLPTLQPGQSTLISVLVGSRQGTSPAAVVNPLENLSPGLHIDYTRFNSGTVYVGFTNGGTNPIPSQNIGLQVLLWALQ
ncbi:MAG TPA: hypothetical protein PKD90_07580, partial [Phnomibacter sp.]|nr:hypothetical protein [Phnomibacter sp.]